MNEYILADRDAFHLQLAPARDIRGCVDVAFREGSRREQQQVRGGDAPSDRLCSAHNVHCDVHSRHQVGLVSVDLLRFQELQLAVALWNSTDSGGGGGEGEGEGVSVLVQAGERVGRVVGGSVVYAA